MNRPFAAFLLFLLFTVTARADNLQKVIDRIESRMVLGDDYVHARPPDYLDKDVQDVAIGTINDKVRKASALVRKVAGRFSMPEAAARPLLEALLRMHLGETEGVEELFREALRVAPEHRYVVGAYIGFLAARPEEEFAATALPLMHRLPNEDAILFRELPAERHVILLADALGRHSMTASVKSSLLERLQWYGSPSISLTLPGQTWQKRVMALLSFGRLGEALCLPSEPGSSSEGHDFTAQVAMAAALTGDRTRARQLLGWYSADDYRAPSKAFIEALMNPPDDPYELLAERIWNGRFVGVEALAVAYLAERGGYHAFAQQVRALSVWRDTLGEIAARYLPKESGVALRRTLAEVPIDTSGIDPTVGGLLSAPRIVPFTTQPIPRAKATKIEAFDCSDDPPSDNDMARKPCEFLRERRGREITGVAVSRRLDQVFSRGGYWVTHSGDGGATWDAPLYTGVREDETHMVPLRSRLPLMTSDGVQLEMRGGRSCIRFSWDALRRDSDGDGLTDLVEERLGSDWRNADSDGDGIVDGKDNLAMVPLSNAKPGPGAEVVAVVLNDEIKWGAVDTPVFLIGDRRAFVSINVSRRVVVLTEEESELYEKKFGHSNFSWLGLVLVRRDGESATLHLTGNGGVGAYRVTKTDTGWMVKLADYPRR